MSTELFPANVTRLDRLKIPYQNQPGSRDLVLKCLCGQKLIIDQELPWFVCLGDLRCPARSMRFEEVVAALVKKGEAQQ